MSTTITNAFKLYPSVEIPAFSKELRESMPDAFIRYAQEAVIISAVEKMTEAASMEPVQDLTFESLVDETIVEMRKNWKDQQFRLSAHLLVDETDRSFEGIPQLYMKVTAGDAYWTLQGNLIQEQFLSLPSVASEFDYWNSSDSQLEYLTEDEWAARKRIWNRLIPGNKSLELYSVSVSLLNRMEVLMNLTPVQLSQAVQRINLPDDAQRVNQATVMFFFKKLRESFTGWEQQEFALENIMKFMPNSPLESLPYKQEKPELFSEAYEEAVKFVKSHPLTL